MRRIIIIATALGALALAAVAYAQATSNTYTAAFSFNQKGAGTAKSPVPMGFTETLTAANTTSGLRAAPLTDIKITLPDAKYNFNLPVPTCSAAKIIAAKSDSGCPKGALVAQGAVQPNSATTRSRPVSRRRASRSWTVSGTLATGSPTSSS